MYEGYIPNASKVIKVIFQMLQKLSHSQEMTQTTMTTEPKNVSPSQGGT